ncbi:hypothetical protein C9F11_45620 (plasmid) [Streptomyces sp. YIM 121038]|uniref:hypothetical protein n=1 Tax=Streptomyces sp. YIM 121038 TaxID=2136401 RepID=UPI001164F6DE|nr:hypothetical protein [Streptomyces sp. YIM 121038]QCX82682.1 hypothetical protein C9F11_45620 [Streptomyces sp. YIM 121038]
MAEDRCPRCGGPLGERPARSRLTIARAVMICTACGTDEAIREANSQAPVPFDEWPMS